MPADAPPALLFDLDGCLVDSLPAIRRCWERTLPVFGATMPVEGRIRELAGPPVDEVARALLPGADAATIAVVVARYRRCSVAAAADVPAFPGVAELLAELSRRGVRMGVATSKSIEVAEPVLCHLGLRERFEFVEGTRLEEAGADKTTVVGRALRHWAAGPGSSGSARVLGSARVRGSARVLGLVGDRAVDVRGAHAHGLHAFGALWGYGSREELTEAGADELLAEPADVAALLEWTDHQ